MQKLPFLILFFLIQDMSITNDELILFILFVDVFRCYMYLLVKVFPYSFISENGILTNEVKCTYDMSVRIKSFLQVNYCCK